MGERAAGLNAQKVRTAKVGRFGVGGGLYLLVRGPETAFWVFRYTRAGKMREMGLGRARGLNAVSLADARVKAGDLHRMVRGGLDPLKVRDAAAAQAQAGAEQAARAAVTFREEAEAFLKVNAPAWRNAKHSVQWRATLATYAYPRIGDLPVSDVATTDVLAVLTPIWQSKPETASRLRGRIETILTAATVKGLRSGDNPARWRGHLASLLPARSKMAAVSHFAALPFAKMPAFMLRLQAADGMAPRALEFTILTAARTSEALHARWTEFDLDEKVWTIPAARMKAAKQHRVPLSQPVLALLRRIATIREGDYVFAGREAGKPLSSAAMSMVLRRVGQNELTVHGFRSSFRDWGAEVTGFASEVIEMALAHAVGDKVEAAYRRGDLFQKRQELMAAWASFCFGVVQSTAEVVPTRLAQ